MKFCKKLICISFLFLAGEKSFSQACTNIGQTPSTAFPICGTSTFHQSSVPICTTASLYVPGCTGTGGALYADKNPYFYKFHCFVSGTLSFVITPLAPNEDYDWQLYDITGRNPDDIYIDNTLVVSGNWSGTYGPTGASATGAATIQCASDPAANQTTFTVSPNLIAGHDYLLLVSHFTDTQSGYDLSFSGGTAVITDTTVPHMLNAKPSCDGLQLTLTVNKRFRCTSITSTGSEFSVSPANATVIGAMTATCNPGFDFDTVNITLNNPLPNGNYDLVIGNGSDGNTLLDLCDQPIASGERVSFYYAAPQPIFADSIGKVSCASDSVRVYFPKKIKCSSIAPDGTDFSVSGPTTVTVISAGGPCVNDRTPYVLVKFSAPIYTKGLYTLNLKAGDDGTILIDECGQPTFPQSINFNTADTVSAVFNFSSSLGCQRDTFDLSHDGAHDVNYWDWIINSSQQVFTQFTRQVFPASSIDTIVLIVSNGTCTDTASHIFNLNNKVSASFDMTSFMCPEDGLAVTNTSTGLVDAWRWNYDVVGSSTLKDPPPFYFPINNLQSYYTVKLVAYNFGLGCTDSARKTVTVLDNCSAAVPNAFTPNNDGLNDYFWPHNALKADNLQFKVYNRWGQIVFSSTAWMDKWDGTFQGKPEPSGIYVWYLQYTDRDTKQPVFRKGTVMLIR